MKKSTQSQFAIDNASILFLAQARKDHTNCFRFSMTLSEDICPTSLQKAVDRVYKRFPIIFARFHFGIFQHIQIPVDTPPQVQRDPGCLITMRKKELSTCAYRVYYEGKKISIEVFHALTDGYGAIASFTALVAEYLSIKYGTVFPATTALIDITQDPQPHELEDAFLRYNQEPPKRIPSRFAYQLPGGNSDRSSVRTTARTISAGELREAAHRYGVTINTLISAVMASSVMDVQMHHSQKNLKPVRIMVPVDLRRIFPSRTLRNFSYYILPTMEPKDACKPLSELLKSFNAQIQTQLQKEHIGAVISNNVKLQNAWFMRIIPLPIKCALMRLICCFFGEPTSSVTVTNLGNVALPEEMHAFVQHMDVTLTPRMLSPYGCTVLSYNGELTINVSRFPKNGELEDVFFQKLNAILHGDSV